jgi:hypothetical protein
MNTKFGIIVFLMLLVLLLGYCLSINKLTLITLGISFLLSMIAGVLSARASRKDKI